MNRLIARIGNVCMPTATVDPRDRPEQTFRYVDISSISRSTKTVHSTVSLLGSDAPSRARKEIRGGDVLVSTVRPNLNAVAVVPDELDGEVASTGFCVLRPREQAVLGRFLFYFCRTSRFVDALLTKARGAQYPAVSDIDIMRLHMPLPPLSEQRRIVEILDQADRLRRLRAEADAKADHIFQTVLAKTLGAPTTWSANSRARSLAELVDLVSGGTPSKREERYWTGEIPWVSPKDMKQEFLHDTEDHISSDAVEDSNLKRVDRGAVLIVVRGMILARKVPVSLVRCSVTINQDLKAILPRSPQVSGEYLWAVLSLARDLLLGEIRTAGHGTRKLDTPDLLQLRIPVPSDTQLALVTSVVLTHEGLVEGRARSRKVIDHLFDVLLGRAFTGQLTASWRESHMTELLDEMQEQTKSLAGVS